MLSNEYIQLFKLTVMVKLVQNYTLTTYLGKGAYGKVYLATHFETEMKVAVKMIPLDKFIEIGKLAELTRNEIETLKLLQDNLHVVKFVEMIKTNNYVYLVYQYCQGGTLEDLMRTRKILPEREALALFRQLISAIHSLHDNFILHRDIKPNNIFFKSGHLKLADFGFCKRLRGADDFTQTPLGSPLYMAPEVLNGEVYGSKADVWSCGIVLFEMIYGYCPFGHCNIQELVSIYKADKSSVSLPQSPSVSAVTKMMLRRMLEKDQFRRISWQDFIYQYEITPQGTVLKKEKDFQYDLMKLIKRTSFPKKSNKQTAFKFDWGRITDKNSSVHSQQLGVQQVLGEQQLNGLLLLKRQLKQFENEHARMLELTLILQTMLDSTKEYQYSNAIMFFLVHTLSTLATQGLTKLEQFSEENKELLSANPNEAQITNKLQVVFRNQAKSVSAKANSIKVTLMQCETLSKDVFRFPQRQVIRKFLGEYLQNYEAGSKEVTALNGEGNKEDTLFLLRVVWGCILALEDDVENKKWRELRDTPSVKPQTGKFELSVQLNRLLVYLGL